LLHLSNGIHECWVDASKLDEPIRVSRRRRHDDPARSDKSAEQEQADYCGNEGDEHQSEEHA
jgi:hypothetical protein